jgi:hypothetical protein
MEENKESHRKTVTLSTMNPSHSHPELNAGLYCEKRVSSRVSYGMTSFMNIVVYRPIVVQQPQQGTVQQPLLSIGFANKHASTATREHSNNGRDIFYVVHSEVL